jgi:hypothetical protein
VVKRSSFGIGDESGLVLIKSHTLKI